MEEKARQFRKEASQFNQGRKGVRPRYPEKLRLEAVSYFKARKQQGLNYQQTALELGVSIWTLKSWVQEAKGRLRPVKVKRDINPSPAGCTLVTPEGYRVEGLSLEGVRQLLEILR